MNRQLTGFWTVIHYTVRKLLLSKRIYISLLIILVFRIFAAAAIFLSLVSLAWNTARAETRSDRRRMIIILMGALAGLPPFCALYLTETGLLDAPFGIRDAVCDLDNLPRSRAVISQNRPPVSEEYGRAYS